MVTNWVKNQENDLYLLIRALDMIHDPAEQFGIDPAEICLLADTEYFSYEKIDGKSLFISIFDDIFLKRAESKDYSRWVLICT